MKIVFSRLAKEDLIDIWLYGEERWGLSKADNYLQRLDTFIKSLINSPEKYPLRKNFQPAVRIAPFKKQLIVYIETNATLQIIRVLHNSMDVPKQL